MAPQKSPARFHAIYFVFAMLAILFINSTLMNWNGVVSLPYSQFEKLLSEGKVKDIAIYDDVLRGKFTDPADKLEKNFVTVRVEPELAERLNNANVTYTRFIQSNFLRTILSWTVPILLFFALWWFLARRLQSSLGGGMMAIGKSKAKVYVENDTRVTFQNVAGVDEAKQELKELVDFLKEPQKYSRLGGRMPKGVLLVGPPGTGKTLLAKAVAGEASVPFFSMSGSDFVEMFVGVGAARVRDLFDQARQKAPCIIFIDELDALGRARGQGPAGGHDEKEQTLNQLLVEMDGFDSTSGLILIGATNRPEILDPALLRAGRFDRQVLVDKPDKQGRQAILEVHVRKIKLAPGVSLEQIAALTPGFTGADLANLANEAALAATRRNGESVTLDDFTLAIERIVAGLEKKNRLLNPWERRIVAYHEMGHALVAAVHSVTEATHKVSIIPRGIGSLGYTIQRPTEDRFLMTREELEAKMSVLLGGRAAEQVVFQHLSTGASDDIARVTDIARSMVTRYGMIPDLGPVAYEKEPGRFLEGLPGLSGSQRNYSEATAREIDEAVMTIVEKSLQTSIQLLSRCRDVLDRSAEMLLQKETLTESELQPFFDEMKRRGTTFSPAAG